MIEKSNLPDPDKDYKSLNLDDNYSHENLYEGLKIKIPENFQSELYKSSSFKNSQENTIIKNYFDDDEIKEMQDWGYFLPPDLDWENKQSNITINPLLLDSLINQDKQLRRAKQEVEPQKSLTPPEEGIDVVDKKGLISFYKTKIGDIKTYFGKQFAKLDKNVVKPKPTSEIANEVALRREDTGTKYKEAETEARRPTTRLAARIQQLDIAQEQVKGDIFPRVSILADRDHIKNQQIDIIRTPDRKVILNFKLQNDAYNQLATELSNSQDVKEGNIQYTSANSHPMSITPAFVIQRPGYKVFVSKSGILRSMLSAKTLVHIELDRAAADTSIDEEQLSELINNIFQNDLKISDALQEPDAEAVKQYKVKRYAWHHKREVNDIPLEVQDRINTTLVREEVFPEYSTFVEPGRHLGYKEKHGRFIGYHNLQGGIGNIAKVFRSGGLMATHERFRRGVFVHGMSSMEDMSKGGADSVFIRTMTERNTESSNRSISRYNAVLVFDPEIYNRTDWYSYNCDEFGSKEEWTYNQRISPDQLFECCSDQGMYNSSNEQMFGMGIPMDKIRLVVHPDYYDTAIQQLKSEGIHEINGTPVEKLFIVKSKFSELYDMMWEGKDK